MKKDIEWLKKEVNELPLNFSGFSMLKQREEFTVNKDDVLELINQLDEPEVLSQEWIEENKKDGSLHYIGYYVPIDSLHDLLVPKQFRDEFNSVLETLPVSSDQLLGEFRRFVASNGGSVPKQEVTGEQFVHYAMDNDLIVFEKEALEDRDIKIIEKYTENKVVIEKPVVPQFVADWYERHKDNLEKQLQGIAYNLDKYGEMPEVNDMDKWINETECPLQTLASLKFGYDVEEEPLYRARLKVITDEFIASYLRTQSSDAEDRLKALEIGSKYIHEDYRHLSEFTEDELKRLDVWGSEQWEVEELEE